MDYTMICQIGLLVVFIWLSVHQLRRTGRLGFLTKLAVSLFVLFFIVMCQQTLWLENSELKTESMFTRWEVYISTFLFLAVFFVPTVLFWHWLKWLVTSQTKIEDLGCQRDRLDIALQKIRAYGQAFWIKCTRTRMYAVAGLTALLLVLCFIWPTMYRNDYLAGKLPIRINRFTGNAEYLTLEGWKHAESSWKDRASWIPESSKPGNGNGK